MLHVTAAVPQVANKSATEKDLGQDILQALNFMGEQHPTDMHVYIFACKYCMYLLKLMQHMQ